MRRSASRCGHSHERVDAPGADGIAGSFLAGYVGQALGWYHPGQGTGFIGSIFGAFVLLIYGFVKGKTAT